jgi:hypothetical protein
VGAEESSSFEQQPAQVRHRRAAVLAGIGLVWAAFMASIGLLLPALVVLVAGALGAAWIGGMRRHLRVPRPDLSPLRQGTVAAGSAVVGASRTGGRATAATTRRLAGATRTRGSTAARGLAAAGRTSAARVSASASTARAAVHDQSARLADRQRSRRRERDPRVQEALASNSEGIALAKAGKPAEAIDAFDTALTLLAETGDRHHEGQVLVNLGVVHHRVGGTEAARFCWSRALERLEPGTRESERTVELLKAS